MASSSRKHQNPPTDSFSNITFLDVSEIDGISKQDYFALAELSPFIKKLYVSARLGSESEYSYDFRTTGYYKTSQRFSRGLLT
ncbi:hypothetical protein M422DRAFT_277364 [Sphaerobolus stellatus SS14]|uniref:Uncharacterized protein n=1 Tax=Sphaerobolus stellatus (strain SS14) TaxID=990650 RepID=A0A0C9U003_SPHS4|nr:hypothetical protein M422DRAFT_277364 [Sphaerobolus stellatus SS14]